MARWLAWARNATHERVLVVCGGWHKPALEHAWPAPCRTRQLRRARSAAAERRACSAGCYLVPFEFRQVDALGGYRSGMPSPMFYQWAWEHGPALGRAIARVSRWCQRLRQHAPGPLHRRPARVRARNAARLRACAAMTCRCASICSMACNRPLIKEALDTPAAVERHPPARTRSTTRCCARRCSPSPATAPAAFTPTRRCRRCCAMCASASQPASSSLAARAASSLVLDRRRADDLPRARLLWQLQLPRRRRRAIRRS